MVTVLHLRCDDPDNTYLTPQELAEDLGCPLSRLTGWRKNGGGPEFTKLGKAVLYQVTAILQWKDEATHRRIGDRPSPGRRRP